ncbi:MAG TPA: hypothetical protein VF366_04885 [Dehalococcoidia bacterium]
MDIMLTERTDYFEEAGGASSAAGIVKALKRTGDFLITFSPIAWLLFFGLIAVLVNWLS